MELYPLLPGESIEIRAREPGGDGAVRYRIFVPAWEDIPEHAEKWDTDYDVYFGVAPRVPDEDGVLKGRLANIVRCPVVWLDLDVKEGAFSRKDRLSQLESHPPNFLVDSGYGFHAYWRLDRDLTPEEARTLMKGMASHFKADPGATDPSRVLRWPGTVNHKNADEKRFVSLLDDVSEEAWNPAALPVAFVPLSNGSSPSSYANRVRIIEQCGVPEGGCVMEGEIFAGRDEAMFEVSVWYKNQFWEYEKVFTHLVEINQKNNPPLSESELHTKVRSAFSQDPPPRITEVLEPEPIIAQPLAQPSRQSFHTTDFNDLGEPTEPKFLWEPYFLLNRLVLLDGEEGIGKGLFLCLLAARYSRDHPFIWFTAEDDPIDDIKPRVQSCQTFFDYPRGAEIRFAHGDPRFNVDKEPLFDMLMHTIEEHDAKVLVMDPGRSFIGPRDNQRDFSYNNEADIRPTMQRLMQVSREKEISIIFVHHFNKNATAPLRYRTTGTGAWRQTVRQQVTMLWDYVLDDGVFGVQKSNIGPTGFVRPYKREVVDHWAVLVPSETLDPAKELQVWADQRMKSHRTSITVSDPEDTLEQVRDWAFANIAPGEDFPNRAALAKGVSLNQDSARLAIKQLKDENWIVRPKGRQGGGYVWSPLWTPEGVTDKA